jgi:hypothetical protein
MSLSNEQAQVPRTPPHDKGSDNETFPEKSNAGDARSSTDDDVVFITGTKGLGVKRIEAVAAQFTGVDKIILFFAILIVAYAYTLDGVIRYTYQPVATADLGYHSLVATITVVRSIMAAAAQVSIIQLRIARYKTDCQSPLQQRSLMSSDVSNYCTLASSSTLLVPLLKRLRRASQHLLLDQSSTSLASQLYSCW